MITAAYQVKYDSKTDQIDLFEEINAECVSVLNELTYTIVETVSGWNGYTHLIETDDVYYLVKMEA